MLLFLLLLLLSPLSVRAAASEPGADVVAEFFPEYNGVVVRHISVLGLKRSRIGIVRWMLGAREGQPFDAQTWQSGIEHLYKTESVYNIHSRFTRVAGQIDIELSLEDKWTLFPYFDFQGGGGSVSFSAGLFDTNLLGTFTNVYAGGGYLDGEYSWEAGASQKWLFQTTYSIAGDVAHLVQPVTFQSAEGSTLRDFTWSRTHGVVTVGKQNGERVYWELAVEAFKDSQKRPSPFIYDGMAQWRVAPRLHLWKVSHSDYLEEGHELTLSAFDANPFNPDRDYHGGSIAWKHVVFLPDTKNIAYFLSYSHMTSAPVAYQYRLGGFDSVRGFGVNRIFGLDSVRANLEYRATLCTFPLPLFDLGNVVFQGALFTDAGDSLRSAGMDLATGTLSQRGTRFLYSAGGGFRAIFLHFADALVRLDVAKAVVPNEGFNVGFGVGQFF